MMYLLEQAGVALVAGTAYGLSPYFRLSIATSQDVLDEGCSSHRARGRVSFNHKSSATKRHGRHRTPPVRAAG